MPSTPLRTPLDRTRQAVLYEAGALTFAVPLLSALSGEAAKQSFALVVAMSSIAVLWTAVYCTAFDFVEGRRWGRSADRRPLTLRILHAAGLEGGLALLTVPLIAVSTGLPWLTALAADVLLTAVYSAYAVLFNLGYDRVFPIHGGGAEPTTTFRRQSSVAFQVPASTHPASCQCPR